MKNQLLFLIKRTFERFTGNKVWLEKPSDPQGVRELIAKLKPVSIDGSLIRIGNEGDGGYIVPDDLEGIKAAVSPGVDETVDFDMWLAERGVDIYMADASVDGPPIDNSNFHFYKKFLDVVDDDLNMRLETLCNHIIQEHDGDRILQMDIEGAEFQVILDASDEVLSSFRIILIEFHNLDRMFSNMPFKLIKATFEKLLRHFNIVHIHPNNVCSSTIKHGIEIPPVMEFTFYRKDRAPIIPNLKPLIPHPLDTDNFISRPTLVLPEDWR